LGDRRPFLHGSEIVDDDDIARSTSPGPVPCLTPNSASSYRDLQESRGPSRRRLEAVVARALGSMPLSAGEDPTGRRNFTDDESWLREAWWQDRHKTLLLQVQALVQSLTGLAARSFKWSTGLSAPKRRDLAGLLLDYVQPCAHIDPLLQGLCEDLECMRHESVDISHVQEPSIPRRCDGFASVSSRRCARPRARSKDQDAVESAQWCRSGEHSRARIQPQRSQTELVAPATCRRAGPCRFSRRPFAGAVHVVHAQRAEMNGAGPFQQGYRDSAQRARSVTPVRQHSVGPKF